MIKIETQKKKKKKNLLRLIINVFYSRSQSLRVIAYMQYLNKTNVSYTHPLIHV